MRRSSSLAALAAIAASLAFPATSAQAQYMYLDANGDGVHTRADVLSSTGVTSVDVWLVTNENRDGTLAACAESPTAQLSIISYEFILLADGGTVKYDGFQNRITEFTYSFGTHQDDTGFYAGRGGPPS